jgi:hypothetical protein
LTNQDVKRFTWSRMVAPNLTILVVALAVFSIGILAYRTVETEYQVIVNVSMDDGHVVAPLRGCRLTVPDGVEPAGCEKNGSVAATAAP